MLGSADNYKSACILTLAQIPLFERSYQDQVARMRDILEKDMTEEDLAELRKLGTQLAYIALQDLQPLLKHIALMLLDYGAVLGYAHKLFTDVPFAERGVIVVPEKEVLKVHSLFMTTYGGGKHFFIYPLLLLIKYARSIGYMTYLLRSSNDEAEGEIHQSFDMVLNNVASAPLRSVANEILNAWTSNGKRGFFLHSLQNIENGNPNCIQLPCSPVRCYLKFLDIAIKNASEGKTAALSLQHKRKEAAWNIERFRLKKSHKDEIMELKKKHVKALRDLQNVHTKTLVAERKLHADELDTLRKGKRELHPVHLQYQTHLSSD